jgi:hypothetical protein
MQGRIPPAQKVLFGTPYQLRVEYGGVRPVQVGESRMETDRLLVYVKGPASELTLEAFFARDAVRTPVLVKVPLPMGVFSVELSR